MIKTSINEKICKSDSDAQLFGENGVQSTRKYAVLNTRG